MSELTQSREFDALLEYLKRTRGFDFNAYKRMSLTRRVQKRLAAVGLEGFGDYTDYLEVHPDEFPQLFNVILINVTSFFRDQPAWDHLGGELLPAMLGARGNGDPIRIWTAGCASGEETYSMAMLLAERIGRDQFGDRVKIYATDIDDQALDEARQATYTEKQVELVPPALLDRYFTRDGERFVFDHQLRRSVIFGRHDLVQDAPISRVDVLSCRNTLMYFNTEAQTRILARFHFALGDGGVLFLGKAEMLITQSEMFVPVDLRRRLFRKVVKDNWRDRLAIMNRANGDEGAPAPDPLQALYSSVFDASPAAQLIIDAAGSLAMFNDRARMLFNLTASDVGRPMHEFELSYRPVELRSPIDQAFGQRRPVSLKDVDWESADREARFFDVHVVPLFDAADRPIGASISFADVSHTHDLEAQLSRSKQDLDTAYEELQSTSEELETTNEELQSTVEELETTNEELQSTNEELETMNEELQSTNEELQTINEELRDRSEDLNGTNKLLESILTGVRSGIVVLDRELHVVAWNHRAEDLWGLRAEEVKGQNFFKLDIGLPADQLRTGLRASLAGDSPDRELTVSATNRRGRSIACKVTVTPLVGDHKEIRGVILVMDEQSAEPILRPQ